MISSFTSFSGKKFKCRKCGQFFARNYNLRKHIEVIHAEDNDKLVCGICNKLFSNPTNLRIHCKRKHVTKELKKKFKKKPEEMKLWLNGLVEGADRATVAREELTNGRFFGSYQQVDAFVSEESSAEAGQGDPSFVSQDSNLPLSPPPQGSPSHLMDTLMSEQLDLPVPVVSLSDDTIVSISSESLSVINDDPQEQSQFSLNSPFLAFCPQVTSTPMRSESPSSELRYNDVFTDSSTMSRSEIRTPLRFSSDESLALSPDGYEPIDEAQLLALVPMMREELLQSTESLRNISSASSDSGSDDGCAMKEGHPIPLFQVPDPHQYDSSVNESHQSAEEEVVVAAGQALSGDRDNVDLELNQLDDGHDSISHSSQPAESSIDSSFSCSSSGLPDGYIADNSAEPSQPSEDAGTSAQSKTVKNDDYEADVSSQPTEISSEPEESEGSKENEEQTEPQEPSQQDGDAAVQTFQDEFLGFIHQLNQTN